eukprot:1726364-Rhodomonas_salina.2
MFRLVISSTSSGATHPAQVRPLRLSTSQRHDSDLPCNCPHGTSNGQDVFEPVQHRYYRACNAYPYCPPLKDLLRSASIRSHGGEKGGGTALYCGRGLLVLQAQSLVAQISTRVAAGPSFTSPMLEIVWKT